MAYVDNAYSQAGDDDEKKKLSSGQADAAPVQGAAGSGGTNPSYTQSNFVSGKDILDKNQGQPSGDVTSKFVGDAQTQAKNAQTAAQTYQQGAQDYQSANTAQGGDEQRAAQGDQGAFSRLKASLSASPYQTYQAQNPYADQGLQMLQRQGGVQDAFSQQAAQGGNYNYNQGQAALDAALFGRSDEGRAQLAEAARQGARSNQTIAAANQAGTQANQDVNQTLAKQAALTRSNIQGVATGIQNQATAQAAAPRSNTDVFNSTPDYANQAAAIASDVSKQYAVPAAADISTRFGTKFGAPGMQGVLASAPNAANFIRQGQAPGQLYNPDQAGQYNRLMDLIGGSHVDAGGRTADTFDTTGYRNMLADMFKGAPQQQNVQLPAPDNSSNSSDNWKKIAALGAGGGTLAPTAAPFVAPYIGAKYGGKLGQMMGAGAGTDDTMAGKAQKATKKYIGY